MTSTKIEVVYILQVRVGDETLADGAETKSRKNEWISEVEQIYRKMSTALSCVSYNAERGL